MECLVRVGTLNAITEYTQLAGTARLISGGSAGRLCRCDWETAAETGSLVRKCCRDVCQPARLAGGAARCQLGHSARAVADSVNCIVSQDSERYQATVSAECNTATSCRTFHDLQTSLGISIFALDIIKRLTSFETAASNSTSVRLFLVPAVCT